jgi:hypothetical protein
MIYQCNCKHKGQDDLYRCTVCDIVFVEEKNESKKK